MEVLHHQDQQQSSSLLLQLNRLRQEEVLTDVLLCCEGVEIPCHRNVLASSSPYFRAMFCSDFLERRQTRVSLRGVGPAALGALVDYVYTGLVSVGAEAVLPLMAAASMLQYERLLEVCSSLLQRQLRPHNCLNMIRLAELMNCDSLRRRAEEVAAQSFPDVAASQDLRELSLPELLGYLGQDGLRADEEQVFEALVAWIRHDPPSRRGAVAHLFRKVRLRHVHPTFLFRFIANEPLVRTSAVCTRLIDSLRRLMFSVGAKGLADDVRPLWAEPRRSPSREALVVVGGRKGNQQTSREALVWDESRRQWRRLAKLPVRLYGASYAALQGLVYVTGGLSAAAAASRRQVSAAVYTLSLKSNQWRTAAPMLEPRFSHQSVSYLHFIFTLGGLGPDGRLTDGVERYNSMFDQWERVAAAPEAVLHPAVAAANQRIYMFGGEDAQQRPVRIIQVYHIASNTWSKMENRTVKNVSAPAAVLDGRIYIIGGFTRRTLAYDPPSNRFLSCSSLKERRMHHSAAVLNGRIYILGGRHVDAHHAIRDSDAFECYDPQTDAWTSRGSLPYQLFDHGSLTLTCVSPAPPEW